MKKLHRFKLLVLSLLFSLPPLLHAQLVYTFDPASGLLTISGNGTTVEQDEVNKAIGRTSEETNLSLKRVDFSKATGITTIGNAAFFTCKGLMGNMTIPAVSLIGEDAFRGCSGLTSLRCLSPTPPVLKSSDPIRPAYPFEETGIKVLYVPEGKIDDYKAAQGWSHYASQWTFVDKDEAVTVRVTTAGTVESSLAAQSEILPSEITQLTVTGSLNDIDLSFMKTKMPRLNTIDLEQTDLKVIPSNAFEKKSLIAFRFPASLESIGNDAFRQCGLTGELKLPATVKHIGDNAFGGCTGLTGTLVLPSGLQNMRNAFGGCTGITSIVFPDYLTTVDNGAFTGCSGLTGTLVLPASVQSIGMYAFNECTGITSVSWPSNLTSIGYWAFLNCSGLSGALTLPDKVETIDESAFMGCRQITSLHLPASLKSIGRDAFAVCGRLTEITCLCSTQPQVGQDAFANGPATRTLNVPNAYSGFGTDRDNQWGATKIVYATAPPPVVEERSEGKAIVSWPIVPSAKQYLLSLYADASKLQLIAVYEFDEQGGIVSRTTAPSQATFNLRELAGDKSYYAEVEAKTESGDVVLTQKVTIPAFNPAGSFAVTFQSQGGSIVAADKVTAGSRIIPPLPPTRENHTFEGWYKEAGCINTWDFAADKVTADVTLYAKWSVVTGVEENKKDSGVSIYGQTGCVVIEGATGAAYSVYTTGPAAVVNGKAEGNRTVISLPPGIYIVKTPAVTRKVVVR